MPTTKQQQDDNKSTIIVSNQLDRHHHQQQQSLQQHPQPQQQQQRSDSLNNWTNNDSSGQTGPNSKVSQFPCYVKYREKRINDLCEEHIIVKFAANIKTTFPVFILYHKL